MRDKMTGGKFVVHLPLGMKLGMIEEAMYRGCSMSDVVRFALDEYLGKNLPKHGEQWPKRQPPPLPGQQELPVELARAFVDQVLEMDPKADVEKVLSVAREAYLNG